MPTIPSLMQAWLVERETDTPKGTPGTLALHTLPVPEPAHGEVLLRVAAAGLNRADIFQKQGTYPPPPGASPVPGLEVSGTIVAVGQGVSNWAPGDTVCALLTGGGYGEYCTAPAEQLLPIPDSISLTDAAALPEACFTVWMALLDEAGLQPGDTLLVHGGASGIGSMAIQMACAMGVRTFATASSDEKCALCEKLGATAINYHTHDFTDVVLEQTEQYGADVILDIVGGDYIQRNFKVAATGGRIVILSFLRGAKAEVNFAPLLMKRLHLIGTTLRARSVAKKAYIATALKEQVWPRIAESRIRPVIYEALPFSAAVEAQTLLETNQNLGKVLLIMENSAETPA